MTNKQVRTELRKIEATLDRLEKIVFKKKKAGYFVKVKAGKAKAGKRKSKTSTPS